MPGKTNVKRYEGVQGRLRTVGWLLVIAFAALVLRLWQLQIVHWYDYSEMAKHNRLHPQRLKAPRGMIYGPDTDVVLADNRPACDLVMVPAECGSEDPLAVFGRLKSLIPIPEKPRKTQTAQKADGAEQDAPKQGQTQKPDATQSVGDAKAPIETGDAAPDSGPTEKPRKKRKPTPPPKTIEEQIRESKGHPYRQILIKEDVSKNDLTRVEEFSSELPGISTVVRPKRRYSNGKTACQILGYMNRVGETELRQKDPASAPSALGAFPRIYEGTDLVGRAGLEQEYEAQMRGTSGEVVLNVYVSDRWPQMRLNESGHFIDSLGRELAEERGYHKDPEPGEPVFTTLDIDLQRFCEELLERSSGGGNGIVGAGAIVVLDADTGAVLTLASVPRFDPQAFLTPDRREEVKEDFEAKPNPIRNRCFQEQYAPGSVFKVLMATAALEEGVINEKTTFYCPGFYQLPGVEHRWSCWNHYGHGGVSVVDALAYSCDVFFFNTGMKLGLERIDKWAANMGLGAKTGIDLPQEANGLIPTVEWKKQQGKKLYPKDPSEWRWYPGNTVNLAIGQGQATTTPLQNAIMMACIVNGGRRVKPYINKAVGPDVSEPFISKRTLEIVRAGMRKCVEKDKPAPTGTGKAARIPGFDIIGKTGSAQIVGLEKYKKYGSEEKIPYALRDHAWFVAGVLDHEPKIALCILVEHGYHGSAAAAPLAKDVIGYFYSDRKYGDALFSDVHSLSEGAPKIVKRPHIFAEKEPTR